MKACSYVWERGRGRYCLVSYHHHDDHHHHHHRHCNHHHHHHNLYALSTYTVCNWPLLFEVSTWNFIYYYYYYYYAIIFNIITYFCSAACLEKLTGSQLVKKFPAFYGTRKLITAFTSSRQLSLSWATSIQSISPSKFVKIILILSSNLCLNLPSGLFPSGLPTKI